MKKINYWHMQIHPTKLSFAKEHIHSILEHKKIIGLGDWAKGEEIRKKFRNDMKVNDIVAIKTGQKLVALVQVIGGWYEVRDDDSETNWITDRRPIRVLDWEIENKTIPHHRKTLEKCSSDDARTTQIVKQWHAQVEDSYKKRKLDMYV